MNADEEVAVLTARIAEAKQKFWELAQKHPAEALRLVQEHKARLLLKLQQAQG